MAALIFAGGCGAADQPTEDVPANLQAVVSIERTREQLPVEQANPESEELGESADPLGDADVTHTNGLGVEESRVAGNRADGGGVDGSNPNGASANGASANGASAEESFREETASGTALAQFLVLPAALDPRRTLDWAGLKSNLPGPTRCWRPARGSGEMGQELLGSELEQRALTSDNAELLELLAAGNVSVLAGEQHTELALNFFPPSGSASGVLYSSRDRSASPLPANTRYQIDVTGSEQVPALTIAADAPSELNEIRMDGQDLTAVASFSSGETMEWSWSEGIAGDRVYIHLSGTRTDFEDSVVDGSLPGEEVTSVVCAFEDGEGSGAIPAEFTADFLPDSLVRVSLHRVREVVRAQELSKAATADLAGFHATLVETTMRFDFEYATVLRAL